MPEENVGYRITARAELGNGEAVVLGEKENRYVTWIYTNGSFFWGHYTEDRKGAYEDFFKRIRQSLDL